MRKRPLMRDFLARQAHNDGCWPYPGRRDADGYAFYKENRREWRAHRAAFHLAKGSIPQGLYVCHRCDNPACCRPDHLFLGTQKDNCADAVRKDRHCRGTRNGQAKINDEAVRAIRKDCRRQIDIAADFGVSQSLVSQIKRKERWVHVKD